MTNAVTTPIYATSTYAHTSPGEHKGYFYGRFENPTRYAFERAVADLEDGRQGYAFASGMAAITTVLDLLPKDSHIIASDDLYGGCYVLFEQIKKISTGLSVSYVDMSREENLKAALKDNTKMIWIETPTNPLLKLADLERTAAFAKKHKLISAVDNTFASPWGQKPLNYGFDLVMHSATKYIGGHSDIIGGAVVVGDNEDLRTRMKALQNTTGAVLGPFDSYLALRGLKTLDVRMERHCASAMKIAQWLEKHPRIEKVYYPGLPSHPQHALAKKQMPSFGGMITTVIKGDVETSRKVLSSFKLFTLAVSLGGVESLIQHPAIMTHAAIPKEQREKLGITDGLARLSIGLEDADDLIEDLKEALS
jgi:cystathionine gamma-lyase